MKNKELMAEMKRADKTQQQMSDALSITISTFNKKINGQSQFTVKEVSKIKDVLDIDNDRLLTIFFDHEV